jgi:hypothetical protein
MGRKWGEGEGWWGGGRGVVGGRAGGGGSGGVMCSLEIKLQIRNPRPSSVPAHILFFTQSFGDRQTDSY